MNSVELAQRCYIGLPGRELDPESRSLVEAYPPAGVILFRRNVSPDPDQIKRLVADLQEISHRRTGRPMVIAIDEEGGTVRRLPPPFTQFPDASSYGPDGQEAVFEWGYHQGRELAALGITMDFAPVLDINVLGPEGFMNRRALGIDPFVVSRLGVAAIKGLQEAGVGACAKHFPGMGQTNLDPHQELTAVAERNREELFGLELIPFIKAIEAGVEAIMISHLIYPGLDPKNPASLSSQIMTGLLREELGYQGLILTDDLDMGSITLRTTPAQATETALAAGADIALLCEGTRSFRNLVDPEGREF